MQKNTKQFRKNSTKTSDRLCLCRSSRLVLYIGKVFGISSVAWKHEHGYCKFERSIVTMCWTFFLILILVTNLFFYIELNSLTEIYVLPVLLNGITDLIYYSYLIITMVLTFWKLNQWISTMNQLSQISRFGLMCESVLKTVNKLVYTFTGFFFTLIILNALLLAYLHWSNSFETRFTLSFAMGKLLQNMVLMFYVFFFWIVALLIGTLTCFEKISMNALKYDEIYPMKKIAASDNKQDIFIFFNYTVCKSVHTPSVEITKLPTAEIIEYFRILHEEISEIIYSVNDVFNPAFLIHVVIEIVMLVINWYSVIIKMAYDFPSSQVGGIFVLNLVFAISHTIGLFVFLRNAQKLSNTIHGYTSFLMEYSTRVSSPDDHLQLRIFIEKIKQHKPLTASGIFTIDLGIAGPIFADILTYVLVALQFEIPKKNE